MKLSTKFSVTSKLKLLLLDMGLEPIHALTHAKLPTDLFNRNNSTLSADEYFRLWQGIDLAAGDKEVALLLAEYVTAEAFDTPIFASLCCQNLNTAVKRLSDYKPLIGPMTLLVKQDNSTTTLQLNCAIANTKMPNVLCLSEAVFFTQLARIGTREKICPTSVTLPELPEKILPYQDYFGCKIAQGHNLSISFSAKDASKTFLTSSGSMWDFFEDKLNKKLADMNSNSSAAERVRATLIEALPSGEVSIDIVAKKLAISKRTLQRKLTAEAETFQSILLTIRDDLAQHYLTQSEMSLGEISYLLGFKEPNSFIRAFNDWNGISPSLYRNQSKH